MNRERDPLAPAPHWRVDLRLVAELPEDNVVGTRFLINVIFTAVALVAVLYAGWIGYRDLRIRREINDWERRIRDSAAEVREIQDMQKKFALEAAKIDQAWTLVRPQLRVHEFLSELGRTRPEVFVIDTIDWNDTGIYVRGSLRETAERSMFIIGNYVKLLNRDEKFSPLFKVKASDIARGTDDTSFKFEIIFEFKTAKS